MSDFWCAMCGKEMSEDSRAFGLLTTKDQQEVSCASIEVRVGDWFSLDGRGYYGRLFRVWCCRTDKDDLQTDVWSPGYFPFLTSKPTFHQLAARAAKD